MGVAEAVRHNSLLLPFFWSFRLWSALRRAFPRIQRMLELSTPVQYVKGVGPRIAEVLAAKGIHTVGDLLHYLPFRYEDRLNPRGISELRPGEMASVIGEVRNSGLFRTRSKPIFQLTVGQGSSALSLVQCDLSARQIHTRPDDRLVRQSRRRSANPGVANHSAAV